MRRVKFFGFFFLLFFLYFASAVYGYEPGINKFTLSLDFFFGRDTNIVEYPDEVENLAREMFENDMDIQDTDRTIINQYHRGIL